ncbi:MAG: hypothetical protein ACRC2S_03210 [Waterburya sp.]
MLIQNNSNTPSGSINVNATQSLVITGAASDRTVSRISASTYAEGNAGNIDLSTPKLIVKDGCLITSSTMATGSAGKVTINADEIEVDGVLSQNGRSDRSNISASSINGAIGHSPRFAIAIN